MILLLAIVPLWRGELAILRKLVYCTIQLFHNLVLNLLGDPLVDNIDEICSSPELLNARKSKIFCTRILRILRDLCERIYLIEKPPIVLSRLCRADVSCKLLDLLRGCHDLMQKIIDLRLVLLELSF